VDLNILAVVYITIRHATLEGLWELQVAKARQYLSYSHAIYCPRLHYHLEVQHGPSFLVPLSPLDMGGKGATMDTAAAGIVPW
jgi:hypothetical protein